MGPWRWLVLAAALAGILVSVWRLEGMRAGLERADIAVGATPATVWRLPGAGPAPAVVIAHGFAGSRQLMEGFAIALARAGYVAVAYDLAGHGRNPAPMTGDPTVIEGTTQALMDELARVSDAAAALPGSDGRLALVGHSMASDIVVRQALRDPRVGAVVAVSMFSDAVTPDAPRNLLVVAGEWERFLVAEALKAVTMRDPAAGLGVTLGDPAAGTGRRAVAAPGVEHVGVLYSATALRETVGWVDAAFGRAQRAAEVPMRGGWVALLLVSVVALGWPLAGLLGRAVAARDPGRAWQAQGPVVSRLPSPTWGSGHAPDDGGGADLPGRRAAPPPDPSGQSPDLARGQGGADHRATGTGGIGRLPPQRFRGLLIAAGLIVPLALRGREAGFPEVLVADYLMLHLGLWGVVVLEAARRMGAWRARWPDLRTLAVMLAVAGFGIGGFGLALDAYVASFRPEGAARWGVVAAMALGAVPFMLADAVLTEGGRAPLARRLAVRGAALGSLALAVALDVERLMFLAVVLPVILLFFLMFGALGAWAARAAGRGLAAGAGLGLFLGWALGVTFPLFAS